MKEVDFVATYSGIGLSLKNNFSRFHVNYVLKQFSTRNGAINSISAFVTTNSVQTKGILGPLGTDLFLAFPPFSATDVLGRPHDQKKQPIFIIYYNQHVVRDSQYLTKCKMNWFPVKMVL
jgi:hypothetical protein